jgi:4'-phosphopantetheinyl transferase
MKVHWLTQKWEQVPGSLDWLQPDEKEVFSRFRFVKKQQDWLLGRWTAKQALSKYFKESKAEFYSNELSILPAADGAPEVFHKGDPVDIHVSLSHSHGIGLCAIGPKGIRIGCDLEKIEPRSSAFIEDYFTDKERAIISDNEEKHKPLLANLIWSAKESVLKALRTGLSIDTRQVQIECSPIGDEQCWNDFHIVLPGMDLKLYGKWQMKSGMVVTMVCDLEGFELVEIV